MSSILNIGKSALAAAQAGLNTTGHNIANAATPGYSRQIVQQGPAAAQGFGYGFVGQGAQVETVRRTYSDFIGAQVNTSQSAKSGLDSYYAQISQVNNLLADPLAGLSPALQGFFNGLQDLSASPDAAVARQGALSSAQSIASRFQSLDDQLQQNRDGINSQIASSVAAINSFAERIAALNDNIAKATASSGGHLPNDLLDQRDFLVAELSKETKATVVKQDGNSYNVFIGTGQALVVGATQNSVKAIASDADPSRISVSFESRGRVMPLADAALAGGKLGGLLEFRAGILDSAQNALGRTAIALATTFNAQHRLGQDLTGAAGGNFFSVATPTAAPHAKNSSTATVEVAITDAAALTTSNYSLSYNGEQYEIKRLSDGFTQALGNPPAEFDGFSLAPGSTPPAAGDSFLIKPTATGAASFRVAITDINRIAAAGPLRTATSSIAGKIGSASVDAGYLASPLTSPLSLTYDQRTHSLSGFPEGATVEVTRNGVTRPYASGTAVDFVADATYRFQGITFTMGGTPASGDTFTIEPNINGSGDNSNAIALGTLQAAKTMAGKTTTYQGAYSQLVSQVGNKTREVGVTQQAEAQQLASAVSRQQNESGVNLDEEAANLMRYQQAYQAAGKVMQTASRIFDVLLSLGN